MVEPWQTRASQFHPYVVDTVDELPDSVRFAAAAALPAAGQFVRALVVPAEYRSTGDEESHPVPEQVLIYTDRGVLHVQAGLGDQPAPTPTFIQPESLLYLRTGHLLLNGQLGLLSAVQGKATGLNMEFNAIGWRMMDAEWRDLVGKAIGIPPLPPDAERVESEQEQAMLEPLPTKFAEGLRRYGLYTGETLLGLVYQPGAWEHTMLLFEEQVAPNSLLALTSASVLVLQEETALVRKSEQYGLTITRIPRPAIAAVQSVTQDAVQEVTLFLARSGVTSQLVVRLALEASQQWLALWARYVGRREGVTAP
jgi:hypothetical protein